MLNASEHYEKAIQYPTFFRPMEEMLDEPQEFKFRNALEIASLFDTVDELVYKMNTIEDAVKAAYKEKMEHETSKMQTMDNRHTDK